MTTTSPAATRIRPATLWTALRVLSTLTALTVLCQGLTAGQVLMHNRAAFPWHEAGSIVLHVVSGLTVLAAGLIWLAGRRGLWPAVIAGLVFVLSFVQGATGHGRTLYIHVPLALTLLIGAMCVASWAWLRRPQDAPDQT